MADPWRVKLLCWLLSPLDEGAVVDVLRRFLLHQVEHRPPRQAMSLLLRLDHATYGLEGKQAVRLGEGLHVKHRLMDYHRFFIARVAAGETVLDLGCGSGAVAYDLASQAGAVVTGLDHNADHIARAQSLYHHPQLTFRQGDVLKETFATPFDVVVLSNLLEHLPDRTRFLQQVMAQTGAKRLLLRVPMYERDWRVPLRQELGLEWRLDSSHEIEYRQEALWQELAEADLVPHHWECRWGEFWLEARPHGP